jgi:hypothetical protein
MSRRILGAAAQCVILHAAAVQQRQVVPGIPGKIIGAVGQHVSICVIAERDAIPVGELIGSVICGRANWRRQICSSETSTHLRPAAKLIVDIGQITQWTATKVVSDSDDLGAAVICVRDTDPVGQSHRGTPIGIVIAKADYRSALRYLS